jgi:hypothetical protein
VVSFPQVSPPKPCTHLSSVLPPSPIRAACPTHLVLDLITQIIFGEYRSLSSLLCSFLDSPVTSSLLDPSILFSTLFSNTLQSVFLPQCDRPSFTPIQNNRKIIVPYILIFKFLEDTGRQKILHGMVASNPWLQSAFNFFLNRILIC